MNEHVLELLEFPKICQMVADRASSVSGRRKALALRPSHDRWLVEGTLDRVRQMRALMIAGADPGAIDVEPLDDLLHRLRHPEEVFEPLELLRFAKLLALSTRVRGTLVRPEVAERFADLYGLGLRFADFAGIVRRLSEVFDPSGEFLDTATPKLAKIRRQLRSARAEAGSSLAELARQASSKPEESFVTLREGRYVLAVHGEDRSRLRGIVHGRSKSGQTVFLEPLQAIDRNNAIASLEADEHEERVEILGSLSRSVLEREAEIVEGYEASAELDLLRAMARMSLDLECVVPAFDDDGRLRLVGARHPLLGEPGKSTRSAVVPLDLDLAGEARTLILSGPNMGGKTVALKATGLLCAMAQSGLHVPAREGVELPFVDSIFADLGDEQSIESETSTFAGHLRNIAEAWSGATSRSLVLLDELGGGTDPEEGTALGRAVIELLSERRCLLLVTTHLVGLKIVAHEDRRMKNGAMEFDVATGKPTYRLKLGAPGRSRAFELARQILPPGELTERAEGYRTRWSANLDELLGDLERKRVEAGREIEELRAQRAELADAVQKKNRQAARLRDRLQAIREARSEAEGRTLVEAEQLLVRARRLSHELQAAAPASVNRGASERVRELEEQVRSAQERSRRILPRGRKPLSAGEVKRGETVWSHDLKSLVKIDSEPDGTERVWILHGTIRFHVALDSLGQPPPDLRDASPRSGRRDPVRGPEAEDVVEREIDIRGRTAREGLEEIERFVDRAAVAGVPEIRIIHGKGKGILKREIEAFLRDCPLVESFRIGEPREGGWGATVVRVRSAQVGP